MSLQAGLLSLVEHSRTVEQEFLAGLPEDERRAEGSADAWSARDLLSHLTAWRHRGADDLAADLRGEDREEISEFDAINLEIYSAHRHLSWDEILDLSQRSWEELLQALHQATDEMLLSRGPTGERRPLWRRATIEATNHPVTHLAEFAMKHGRVEQASRWVEGMTPALLALDPSPEWNGVVHYNLACHQALTGQPEAALASLEAALTVRPDLREWSTQDPDLEPLRGRRRFAELTTGDG